MSSLGDDCTWTLTADTYITSFKGEASHIKTNGHRLFRMARNENNTIGKLIYSVVPKQ